MRPTVVINIPEVEYQKLKVILEEEHDKEFSIEDVREIADNLIELYLHIASLMVSQQSL